MKKSTKIILYSATCFYFIIYFIATVAQSDFWGNILSPVGALISFSALIYAYKKANYTRICWLAAALASLSWAVADILWAVFDMGLGLDPNEMDLFMVLYLFPNVFLCIAVLIFMIPQFQKWNGVQLLLDIVAITFSYMVLIWVLYVQKDVSNLADLDLYRLMLLSYLFFDALLIAGMTIWYFSIRKGRVAPGLFATFFSLVLFAVTDLYYSYLSFYELYIPNSVVDSLYMLSLLLLAHGGLLATSQEGLKWYKIFISESNNVGKSKKGQFLLSAPLILVLLGKFDLGAILLLLAVFIIYEALSGYVQNAIKDKQLLEREKNLNVLLEDKIAERTGELIKANKELDLISKQDYITNMYNRRYFITELDRMLQDVDSSEPLMIFYLDLDRFKAINDAYGHDIGDEVLFEVSRRVTDWNVYGALLARLGGDEFVFAFKGTRYLEEAEKLAQELISCCSRPIFIYPYQFNITLSIGITLFPKDAKDRSDLLKNADIAMYHAKSKGFNKYAFFNSDLNEKIRRKNKIEILLRKADYDKEFYLVYQPQFSIPGREITGVEALIRWDSPEKGNITPGEFIPIAEEIGCIVQLGDWIIKKAAAQISEWNNTYNGNLKVGINISPKQLDGVNFVNKLLSVMKQSGVPSEWLDIEITESIAMKGETTMEEIFSTLAANGLTTSIDDFGTGYSSLSYIMQFSFDRLKIAKPLIDSVATDFNDTQIVKAIIMMAKALGIKTIAEGVETEDQLSTLIKLGCDEIQGYIFSKPLSPTELEERYLNPG